MSVNPGGRRDRLQLQKPNPGPRRSPVGQVLEDWITIGTFSCEVRPMSGREAIVAGQVAPSATVLVKTGWLGQAIPVAESMRWIWNGRKLNIVWAENDPYKTEITCYCQEIKDPIP